MTRHPFKKKSKAPIATQCASSQKVSLAPGADPETQVRENTSASGRHAPSQNNDLQEEGSQVGVKVAALDPSQESLGRLAGKTIVANISGGKDSTAMSLWLHEHGIAHRRVFADTGWEHPKTYEYIRDVLTPKLGPIDWVRGERQMVELIKAKGMFPSRQRRFCTEELKVKPITEHMLSITGPAVTAIGIRADESQARASLPEWEGGLDLGAREIWRPLIRWSEDEVIEAHRRNGVPPNPLYLMGASRVGCWPCINARKEELRVIGTKDPGRIEDIRKLEAEVAELAGQRHERDRLTWAASPDPEPDRGNAEAHKRWAQKKRRLESPFHPPAFFQGKMIDKRTGDYPCWPIDEVVRWTRTSRGGRLLQLFAPDSDSGCMRWGLCDQGTEPDAA